jgi:hypothetical protein
MKKEKEKNAFYTKNFIALSIIGIVALVVMLVTTTYAVFTFTGTGTKDNKVSTGIVTLSYIEGNDNIKVVNSLPITDEVGKTLERTSSTNGGQGFFDFTLSCNIVGNDEINYEIYAIEQPVADKLSPEYVKIYLTDGVSEVPFPGYDKSVPTYADLTAASADSNGKRIYAGTFSKTTSKTYRLRMWLADTYTVTSVKRTFTIKINVKAD